MKSKTIGIIVLFSFWSLLVIGLFHADAFKSELRYTRVAEGNISRFVHLIWQEGFTGFMKVLANDAKVQGRIRPGHWLYYSLPFAATLLRNGDLLNNDSNVPISDRINGDLQTHCLFLLANISLLCGCVCWLIWSITKAFWGPLLLPVYLASFYALSENFIVYNCDSQEIPQLLFIALYLVSIAPIFRGRIISPKMECLSILFLASAYSIKETSVLLMPAFVSFFAIRWFFNRQNEKMFLWIGLRQSAAHFIFSGILMALVWIFRSGSYVSTNYKFKLKIFDSLINNFNFSWTRLQYGVPWKMMIITGGICTICILLYQTRKRHYNKFENRGLLYFSILLFLIAFFFWMINIPWQQQMAKYYLPALLFISAFAIMLQIGIFHYFFKKKQFLSAFLWLFGTIIFMTKDLPQHWMAIHRFYDHTYAIRETVPIISSEVFHTFQRVETPLRTILIVGKEILRGRHFQEGSLPIQRQINHIYGINIAVDKKIVKHVNAIEKNFYRIYPENPSAEIIMREKMPSNIFSDDVYVYLFSENEKSPDQQMANHGFVREKIWIFDNARIRLFKYSMDVNQDSNV